MNSPSAPNAPVAHGTGTPDRSLWTRLAAPLLIAIAFLLALTTARNTDVWAHLAAGRDASSGTISRPLSWLADLAAYLVYSASGGSGLVLGKAVLFAATAAVMLGRGAPWRAVLGVFLAVLALGGSLTLNPTCVSYLLLAVAVSAIDRRAEEPESTSTGWRDEIRTHRALLVCFVIWANVDIWSLLGVAVVGARVVGRTLVRAGAAEPHDGGAWRLFVLLVGAQLLSPIPWHISTVAREFGNQFASTEAGAFPFRPALFSSIFHREFEGLVPFCAFWLLVCVGISSFVLAARSTVTARQQAWERLFPLVGLFIASALNVRFVPFFVVVCGATGAQNFRSLPSAGVPAPGARRWDRVERLRFGVQCLFAALAATVLLAASWAGWLQALPAERRNWTLEPDPSLVRAAEQVEEWYASGLLTADQETVFFATEAEDTFAWFAPRSAAGRRVVGRGPAGVAHVRAEILTPEKAAAVLDDPRIGCVVLCDPSRTSFTTALRNMTAPKSPWTLAHLRGRVAVFVRTGTGAARPVDFAARAFGLSSADRAEWSAGRAFVVRPRWFDPFVVARPPRSIDRDEAVTYLLHEEATRDHRMVNGANRFLETQLAALAGSPPPGPAGWVTDPRVDMLTTAAGAVRPPSEAPPPLPFGRFAAFLILTDVTAHHYLAVRAARRGVAASPRDAACYEALGEAYLHLLSDPLETSWNESAPALRRLRLTQAAAAFRQALALEPARAPSHLGLATVYFERQFLDLAIAEFRAYERFARIQGQQPTDAAERIRALERTVESARRTTEANAANLGALDRARLAARNGLTGQALDVLLQSDVSAFGAAGITLELDLLLSVGRVTEAREWLAPEHRKEIGAGAYDWFGIQSAAAVGDYAGASAILLNQIVTSSKPEVLMSADELLGAVRVAAREALLFKRQSVPRMALALILSVVNRFADAARQVALDHQARSEGYLLLALLALEAGDIGTCDGYLNQLLGVWGGFEKAGIDHPAPHRAVALQMRALIRR
jgi:hypothetical protein